MNSSRNIGQWIILLCAIFIGCTGLPAVTTIEQTPSPIVPSATQPPTATFTPPATFTAVYSPTPESLPLIYIESCENAFNKGTVNGTPQAPVLFLSTTLYESKGWEILGFVEHPMAEFKTLACIKESRQRAFTYTDGTTGWRISRDVRLVEIETGNVIGAESYVGGDPPSIKFKPGDEYGSSPAIEMLAGVSAGQEDPNTIRMDITGSTITVSPDGKTFVHLAAGSQTGTAIVIRDTVTRQVISQFESFDYPDSAEFSPDGKFLLTASFSSSRSTLWDVSSGTSIQSFPGRYGTLSPDGQMVAAVAEDPDTLLEKLVIRDAVSGNEVRSISDMFQYPFFTSIRFSPDGETLVFQSTSLVVWNIKNWQMERTINTTTGGEILAFSPDGNMLATASEFYEAFIELWNPRTGQRIHMIGPIGNPNLTMRVKTLSFSPDSQYLAAGLDDGTVRVWETTHWLEIHTYYGNFGDVDDLDFSPDGKTLYAAVLGYIKIFDLASP